MTSADNVLIRPASTSDAAFLIPLFAESSGGVWPAIWKALANDDEDAVAAGVRYLTDPGNELSVRNTVLAELDGTRLGAMASYRERPVQSGDPGKLQQSRLPEALARALGPYRELSDPDSLFIAELCLLPEARGQGLGTRLLNHARRLAGEMQLPGVSLRVFSANAGAVRLYERSGFRVVDERPVVPHEDIRMTGRVYLMTCPV